MAERRDFSSAIHAARFAVGLLVVLVHFFPLPLASMGISGLTLQAMNSRNLCSSFFFVLSGFLVVITASKTGRFEATGPFIIRRLARLWPAHVAGFIIMIPTAFVGLETVSGGRFIAEAAAWLSMMHGFWPSLAPAYNGPAWAVTSFALGYCLAPWLVRLRSWPRSKLVWLAVAVWLIPLSIQASLIFSRFGHWDSQVVHHLANGAEVENLQLFLHTSPLFRLPMIASGGIAALMARKVSFSGEALAAMLALPLAVGPFWIGGLPDRWLFLLTHGGVTPVLMGVMIVLWHCRGWLDRVCDRTWLRRGGQAGILLYFLHRPVFTVLDFALRQIAGFTPADSARSLPLACVAAAVSVSLAYAIQPAYDENCRRLAGWVIDRFQRKRGPELGVAACSR